MHKRPVNSQFNAAIQSDIKVTTIRNKPWPIGVPIMLYNWSGKAYRSKQIDLCPIVVDSASPIDITHHEDGSLSYRYNLFSANQRPIHQTEGFPSQEAMDTWFRPLVKPSTTQTAHLMRFHRLPV